jgi:ubiquitin-small subunit ribosomal protein S27Ae
MAEAKKSGGAPKKKRRQSARYKLYEKKGNSLSRKNPFCPKCGQGFFLARHKDRLTCGKCGYMEKTK